MVSKARAVGAALGTAALVALTACSSTPAADKPATLPSLNAGTAAALSPTASAASAAQSAANFARDYYQTLNAASQTGDTREMRRLSAAQCASCIRLADSIDGSRQRGEKLTGGQYSVVSVTLPVISGNATTVTVMYTFSRLVVTNAAGSPIRTLAARNEKGGVSLEKRGVAWVVTRLVRSAA